MTKVKADVSAKFIAALDGIRARGDDDAPIIPEWIAKEQEKTDD